VQFGLQFRSEGDNAAKAGPVVVPAPDAVPNPSPSPPAAAAEKAVPQVGEVVSLDSFRKK